MRDNFIFTGIDEPEYIEGDTPENAELSLRIRDFLKREMQIDDPVQFHIAHRINHSERQGMYNYGNNENNSRPIVAKFEGFKGREYVRMKAPKTLKGKHLVLGSNFLIP